MSDQKFCAVMLFVGNTYKVGHNSFVKDRPVIVHRDVYEYIRKAHYSHFRFWEQDTSEITPETLVAHGIIVEAPQPVSPGLVTVQDIKDGRKNPAPVEFGKAPEEVSDKPVEEPAGDAEELSDEEKQILADRAAKHTQLASMESEAGDAGVVEPAAVNPEDVAGAFKDPGVAIDKAVGIAEEELATDAPVGSARKKPASGRRSSKKTASS